MVRKSYSLRPRLFPALIASAAAIVLLAALVPWDRPSWAHALASVGVIVILYAMADFALMAREVTHANFC